MSLTSVLVLSTSGYGWAMLHTVSSGITSSDVIGQGTSGPNGPDGAMDVLLIGNDSRTDAQGNPLPEEVLRELRTTDDEGGDLTDTMIMVRIPNGGGRASAVSFPRDSLVNLGPEHGTQKLTEALTRQKSVARQRLLKTGLHDPKELERQSKAEGQRFLVKTIEKLTGVGIDHYAEVNLLGFHDITEAVGGVDVCLNDDVDDSEYSGAVFRKGPQTIAGADALAFVRQRHKLQRGDLDRVVRQQVFMSSLAHKILSSGTLSSPGKLTALMQALNKSVVLDKNWDVVGFAEQMQGIAGGNIEFNTIPVKLVGDEHHADVVVNPRSVQEFVADLLLPPEQRKAQQHTRMTTQASRAETKVDVYNSSKTKGLAGEVLQILTAHGFTAGAAANAESMSISAVYHAAGEEAAAKQVADALGGLPIKQSQNVDAGSVQVYLGGDYQGPGASNFAGPRPVVLDGKQRTPPIAPEQPAITANGVPCVN